jgi:putative ATPase
VTMALGSARRDAQRGGDDAVPVHLRDAHYQGAASLGHGDGYEYPHNDPRGWVAQQHRPDELEVARYYEPSPHGDEAEIARRMHARTHQTPAPPIDGPLSALAPVYSGCSSSCKPNCAPSPPLRPNRSRTRGTRLWRRLEGPRYSTQTGVGRRLCRRSRRLHHQR